MLQCSLSPVSHGLYPARYPSEDLGVSQQFSRFSNSLPYPHPFPPTPAPALTPIRSRRFQSEDLSWLSDLPYTISMPSLGCVVVHAGLVPGVPLADQRPGDMVTMRNLVRGGGEVGAYEAREKTTEVLDTTRKTCWLVPPGVAWAKLWGGPEHVYFGHDAKRGFQREQYATGLDTGCLYGRSLSAAVLPGGRVVSVQAQQAYVDVGVKR
ncbi:unnamed protein product, partial [Discosporangium mesarthrocarpum]